MKDRKSNAPGRYSAVVPAEDLQKLQSGEAFSITLSRDDDPVEQGTPYSKGAVLPDEVAAAICPDIEDPTPADAFAALNTKVDGKAPAGYGLGESSAKAFNWNSHWRSGFYKEYANSPDGALWHGITCVESGERQTQVAFRHDVSYGVTEARRYKKGGTFGNWEYVNPPMLEGVEYRTTERHLGKPVYTKVINFGPLPNADTTYIDIGASGTIEHVLDVKASYTSAAGEYVGTIPEVQNIYAASYGSVAIKTADDASAFTATVTVKYTMK